MYIKKKSIQYTMVLILLFVMISYLFACNPTRYTITFESNGGSEVAQMNIKGKHTINLPTTEKDGYTFAGWYFDNETWQEELIDTTYAKKKLKEDIKVYAKWVFFGYTIKFDTDNGSEVDTQIIAENERIMIPPFTEKENYNFLGWCIDSTRTTFYEFGTPINSSMTLYAKWVGRELQYFDISFVSNGGTSVDSMQALEGQSIELPTISRVGYIFKGWFINKECTLLYPSSNIITSTLTLYAKWEEHPDLMTISFDSNGGGVIADIKVMLNEVFDEPLPEKNGYDFNGWYTDANLTQKYNFHIGAYADISLYASWTPSTPTTLYYDVLYYSKGNLIRTLSFEENTIIPYTEEELEDWIFEGWYSDEDCVQPFDFTKKITQNISLYAKWREVTSESDEYYTYSLSDDMSSYTITKYEGTTTNLIIPETYNDKPIRKIGNGVFESKNIERVEFSTNIRHIGISAFENCNLLTEVIIPNSLESIGSRAFAECDGLVLANIGTIAEMGNYIFEGCVALKTLIFDEDTTRIAPHMFQSCNALQRVVLPENCIEIEAEAFKGCKSLSVVTLSNSLKIIGNEAFADCFSLSNIDFQNVEIIKSSAFENTGLNKLVLSDSIQEIGSNAFGKCKKLETVEIGLNLERMDNSFVQSEALKSFEVDLNNEYFSSLDGNLYNKSFSIMLHYAPAQARETFSVPSAVEKIAAFAFSNARHLTSLTLPSSLHTIEETAFLEMSGLQNIYCENDNDNFVANDGVLYNKKITKIIKYPINKQDTTFTMPTTITDMSAFAFMGVKNLSNITMSKNLTRVSDYGFFEATNLSVVTFPNNSVITEIASYSFYGCENLSEINLPATVTMLGEYCFAKSGLTNIVIHSNITEIGNSAFEDCQKLVNTRVGAGVKKLSNNIFGNCTTLSEVIFFGSPISIDDAFGGCIKIETVEIKGDGKVTVISNNEFSSKPTLIVTANRLDEYIQAYINSDLFGAIKANA